MSYMKIRYFDEQETPPADNMGVENKSKKETCHSRLGRPQQAHTHFHGNSENRQVQDNSDFDIRFMIENAYSNRPNVTLVSDSNPLWHIDWLTLTVWGDDVTEFFDLCFVNTFRELINLGHGGRFYMTTMKTDMGIIVRTDPVNQGEPARTTIEFPGEACQFLGYHGLKQFYELLNYKYEQVRVNRIDLAFDNCPFSVSDVVGCIQNNELRSYFKRETVKIYHSPWELDDDGNVGTSGITLGGRSSTRYMRIYDKHGSTRLEGEFKKEKAQQVANDLFCAESLENALKMAVGHIRDYVDFFAEWWDYFCSDFDRLYKKLPEDVQEKSVEEIKEWFKKQISTAFYVLMTLDGSRYLNTLYDQGKDRYRKSKYQGLIELVKRQEQLQTL